MWRRATTFIRSAGELFILPAIAEMFWLWFIRFTRMVWLPIFLDFSSVDGYLNAFGFLLPIAIAAGFLYFRSYRKNVAIIVIIAWIVASPVIGVYFLAEWYDMWI